LHPSTRRHEIIQVRAYLRWLLERGELRRDPNDLVRSSDFPKLPTYLPRPLPQDIDDELQRRLRRVSTHSHYQALLLMRQTGIRIGELQRLSYSCVSRDSTGRCFLKVPLGKLNNERLVPLSDETIALIDTMREHAPLQRRFLVTPRATAPRSACDKPVPQRDLRAALRRATEGLETSEPIVPHRLRHTYATSLLNAGMSLVSVMKLLGHRDYRMTLRYAAITQHTITKEYDDAVRKLRDQYPTLPLSSPSADNAFDPIETINRLLAWTHTASALRPTRLNAARSLSKRLRRIRIDLNALLGDY
jgi:site-specific recombinase XerD